jgi:hypothetical protein
LALGQHRSTQRKIPQGRHDEERLTSDIIELTRQYGRYGYRKIGMDLSAWLRDLGLGQYEQAFRDNVIEYPAHSGRRHHPAIGHNSHRARTPVITTVIQPPSANFSTNVTTRMLPVTRSPKQERAMRCSHLRSPRRARHQ